jgi:hypothetical protein
MALATHAGRCHCGAVRFEADTDLEAGTLRGNCSICAKSRFWLAFVPAGQFRLRASEEILADYRFGTQRIRHRFATVCGVKPVGMAANGSGVAFSIACLEGLGPERLGAQPVRASAGMRCPSSHPAW